MKNLINSIKSSEFLSPSELLKLKVSLVLFFMFIFGALTVPISIFEEFAIGFVILVPVSFIFMFILSIVMLTTNKVRVSMHLSIYTFIGLTVYYIAGTNQLYGYLLFFITLIIIIFYQDMLTYLFYGGAITIYGIYYVGTHGVSLQESIAVDLFISNIIYQSTLIGFYLIFLVHFVLSDSMNEKLNNRYLQIDGSIKNLREIAMKYSNEIDDRNNIDPIYDNYSFQQAVSELSIFMNEFFEHDGNAISEAVEFYFYLHHLNIEDIENKNSNPVVKKYTSEFRKYLLNSNSQMIGLLFDFICQFKSGTDEKTKRYEFQINNLLSNRTNKVILLVYIYKFLKTEKSQKDKWGRLERYLSHEEIVEIIESKKFREFISYEDVTFFLSNQDLFENSIK
jgi:hypothetical protein